MPIKNDFLPLVGQPRGPALVAIEQCVAVAADLGATITALALEEDVFEQPRVMLPDDGSGSSTGKVLGSWANCHDIDAFVMGAYHRSRLNEIVLGGVTKTVIGQPPCWVMISH